ncbi:hypothetical protein EJ08DRAFT_653365 [Tothia fuscella]|uniref:Aminoglycoside phosphotransferase domain-containing protein n=1 Tax=Tothia fuscella TaxID=1048955 RepID=A0A9P4TU03_9PEZI|nr:hypothetical protein EJ08DRAFT_653365 [Tothia fuscella]
MFTQTPTLPSDFDIVQICQDKPPFAGSPHGNRLVEISEDVVVKFGLGVRKQEAENQIYAHQHVDSAILYIPQVFRFFAVAYPDFTMGYLIMERIVGCNLQDLDLSSRPDVTKHTIEAMRHLRSIPMPHSQGPGPVGGALAQGYLWSDDGAEHTFTSVEDMETWMNSKADVIRQPHMSLRKYELGMCHMDLVRRNIFLLPNSTICFVDWAFAGFFPTIFEIYTFRELRSQDELWFNQLLDYLPTPSADDEKVLNRLWIPAFVGLKYALPK